ncbi:MAG: hypothetical protein HZA31_03095 [Opitutae bacterium]|nr:hypothetical protein [Opitutae bacterium]
MDDATPAQAEPRYEATTSRLLEILARPPSWSRAWSRIIVFVLVGGIGAIDYYSGVNISLRPFYFIPLACAVMWLGWRWAMLVTVVSVGVWFIGGYFLGSNSVHGPTAWWNVTISLVTFLIMARTLYMLVMFQRELERRVLERTAALREALAVSETLRRDLLDIGARERHAVGHELHDGLGQHLTGTAFAAKVHAEHLAQRGNPLAADAQKLVHLVQEGIGQTRLAARGLLLESIEPEQLIPELEEFATSMAERSPVACQVTVSGTPRAPDAVSAAQLYRIAQEAVRNAYKHAVATKVDIVLTGDDRELRLEVRDNGIGLPPPESRAAGLGLRIMTHRAAAVGGTLTVECPTRGGTRIVCRLDKKGKAC